MLILKSFLKKDFIYSFLNHIYLKVSELIKFNDLENIEIFIDLKNRKINFYSKDRLIGIMEVDISFIQKELSYIKILFLIKYKNIKYKHKLEKNLERREFLKEEYYEEILNDLEKDIEDNLKEYIEVLKEVIKKRREDEEI